VSPDIILSQCFTIILKGSSVVLPGKILFTQFIKVLSFVSTGMDLERQ
jgi:hypothetical protein